MRPLAATSVRHLCSHTAHVWLQRSVAAHVVAPIRQTVPESPSTGESRSIGSPCIVVARLRWRGIPGLSWALALPLAFGKHLFAALVRRTAGSGPMPELITKETVRALEVGSGQHYSAAPSCRLAALPLLSGPPCCSGCVCICLLRRQHGAYIMHSRRGLAFAHCQAALTRPPSLPCLSG